MRTSRRTVSFGCRVCRFFRIRHRIVSPTAPRMAAADALQRHPAAAQCTVADNRLRRVGRTGRGIPARHRHDRRNEQLVSADQGPNQFVCRFHPNSLSLKAIDAENKNRRLPGVRFRGKGVQFLQRGLQIADQRIEPSGQRARPADHHEIVSHTRMGGNNQIRRRPEATASPVTCYGIADLAADRESHPHVRFLATAIFPLGMPPGLKDQAGRHPSPPRRRDPEEFRTSLQAVNGGGHRGVRPRGACDPWRDDWQ